MDNKIILTIGRQFGSGGREIGQRLAKELGIGYYDKELITVAARESGLCEDVFEKLWIPCSIRRWVCLNGNSIPRFRIIRVT